MQWQVKCKMIICVSVSTAHGRCVRWNRGCGGRLETGAWNCRLKDGKRQKAERGSEMSDIRRELGIMTKAIGLGLRGNE